MIKENKLIPNTSMSPNTLAGEAHLAEAQFLLKEETLGIQKSLV
jgi:hypothetical protein